MKNRGQQGGTSRPHPSFSVIKSLTLLNEQSVPADGVAPPLEPIVS